jgi:hypothetical protein
MLDLAIVFWLDCSRTLYDAGSVSKASRRLLFAAFPFA